jgi:hypothetical protein
MMRVFLAYALVPVLLLALGAVYGLCVVCKDVVCGVAQPCTQLCCWWVISGLAALFYKLLMQTCDTCV